MFRKSRNYFEVRFDNETMPKIKEIKKILYAEIEESLRVNDVRRYRYSVDIINRMVELENSILRLAIDLQNVE